MTLSSAPASATVGPKALFVGLCRSEWIQCLPTTVSFTQVFGAGGPAASAAVTFAFLGGQATLLTGVGRNERAKKYTPTSSARASASSTWPRPTTPARQPLSPLRPGYRPSRGQIGSGLFRPRLSSPPALEGLVGESGAVLVDGHHPDLARAAARAARERGRLCLLDARDWQKVPKPHRSSQARLRWSTLLPAASDGS